MKYALRLLRMLTSAFVLVSSVLLFTLVALRGEVQPPPTFEKQYHSMLAMLYLRTTNADLRPFIERELNFSMLSSTQQAAVEAKIWGNYLTDPDAYESDWGQKSENVSRVLDKRKGEFLLFLVNRAQHVVKQPAEADRVALRLIEDKTGDEELEGGPLREALVRITHAAANLNQQLNRRSFSRSEAQQDVQALSDAVREFEQNARAEPPYLMSHPRYKAYVYEAFDYEPSSALAGEARAILLNPAEDTLLRLNACHYLQMHLPELQPIKEQLLIFAMKEADVVKPNERPDDVALRLELLRLVAASMQPLPDENPPGQPATEEGMQ